MGGTYSTHGRNVYILVEKPEGRPWYRCDDKIKEI
jgi:hypothetical protein